MEHKMKSGMVPKGILKDIIIVVIGVLIIWMGLRVVFGTENPFYVVSSGSMIPELQVFDVLVVQGNDPFESVKIGDVIVFDRPEGKDRVIVHRVAIIIAVMIGKQLRKTKKEHELSDSFDFDSKNEDNQPPKELADFDIPDDKED